MKSDTNEQKNTCNQGNIFVILNFFKATEEKPLSADDILYVPVTCARQLPGLFEMDPEHVHHYLGAEWGKRRSVAINLYLQT